MNELKSVSDVVDATLEDLGLRSALELWRVKCAIESIFDKGFSDNMRVIALQSGVLTILVPSSVWIQELSFLESDMIKKINKVLGGDIIDRIRFKEVH